MQNADDTASQLNNFHSSLFSMQVILKMTTVFKVFAALASIIGSCGVIFNLLVCLVYVINSQLLNAANIFILNISVGDFLYSILAVPLVVLSNAHGEWLFGEAGCTAYGFLTTFFALGSMMNLAGAAYERYVTLCKLYDDGEVQFSRKKAFLLSSLLWCYAFFWSLMPVLGWSSYVQEGVGTSCSVNWRSRESSDASYAICLMVACFLLPVALIVFCHFKAYKVISQLSEQAKGFWGEDVIITQDTLAAERKMTWIAVAMTTGFLFAWTPYTISSLVAISDPGLVSKIAASIPAYIAKSSACYNPFIYMFMYKKLWNRMKRMLCCKKVQVHPEIQASPSAQTRHNTTSVMPRQHPPAGSVHSA